MVTCNNCANSFSSFSSAVISSNGALVEGSMDYVFSKNLSLCTPPTEMCRRSASILTWTLLSPTIPTFDVHMTETCIRNSLEYRCLSTDEVDQTITQWLTSKLAGIICLFDHTATMSFFHAFNFSSYAHLSFNLPNPTKFKTFSIVMFLCLT